jgi:hypothetical protein
VRKTVLSIVSAAAVAMCGSGVASAGDGTVPTFCIGQIKGHEAEMTCKPPSAEMRWMAFARCRATYPSGGSASWWNRSAETKGARWVPIKPCVDSGATKVWVDLLAWDEIK